jgi:hypothetical protein
MNLVQRLSQMGVQWNVQPVKLINTQAGNGFVPRLQVLFLIDAVPAHTLLPLQASEWSLEQMLTYALAALREKERVFEAEAGYRTPLTIPAARTSELETMTLQEVWEAAGGNPGVTPTREDVVATLRILDEVCDGEDEQSARHHAQVKSLQQGTDPTTPGALSLPK